MIEQEEKSPNLNSCDSTKVYFQNDILPIFISNCAFSGCHDAGTGMSGVILTTYENIMGSDVIEVGEAEDSDLFERIIENDPNNRMPLGRDPLPQQQVEKIRQWINDGAPNTSCNERTGCDTSNIVYSGIISRIVETKCQGCHSGLNPGGNINLTSYNGVRAIALDQRMLNAVLHSPGFKAMPLGGDKLAPCEIEAIRIWTNDGAPNN